MSGALASYGWLLRHELRLTWRGLAGRRRRVLQETSHRRWPLLWAVAALAGIHLLMWPMAVLLLRLPGAGSPAMFGALQSWLAVVWLFSLSTAMTGISQAVFARGDLELLLSSPVDVRAVLFTRALAIALRSVGVFLLLGLPMAHVLLLLGHPRYLSLYPLLLGMALSSVAAGLLLMFALLSAFGPGFARKAAGVVAALAGGIGFLLSQRGGFLGGLLPAADWPEDHWAWLPARALMAEFWPLLAISLGSVLLFAAVVQGFGPAFAASVAAADGGAPAARRSRPARRARFRNGPFRAVVTKEWRGMTRDPALWGALVSQTIYIIPVGFALWRTAQSADEPLAYLAPLAVMLTSHVADGFVLAVVNGEGAREWLPSTPVAPRRLLLAKLTAALVPTAAVAAPVLALLAWLDPVVALWAAGGAACAGGSAVLISLWFGVAVRRPGFNGPNPGSLFARVAVLLVTMSWSGATGLAIAGAPWAVLPAALALVIVLVARARRPPD